MTERAEFDILQDDMLMASVEGLRADAIREACHYAMIYGQDGPVAIMEITRTPVSIEDLRAALAAREDKEPK